RHTRFSRDWSSDVCSSDLPNVYGWFKYVVLVYKSNRMMKTINYITCLLLTVISFTSCKDLMTVRSEDQLSGDEFWSEGNEANVEAFALSMYGFFRQATMMDAAFFVNTGDLRAAPVVPYSTDQNHYVRRLTANNISELVSNSGNYIGEGITKWNMFYRVVQTANMLMENIDLVPGLSEQAIE